MKNFMRNLLPMLFCTLLWCMEGCTTDRLSDPVSAKSTDESLLPKPRSIEDAVFNEGAQTWMIPQKDPYTLANFQKAFENLKTETPVSNSRHQPILLSPMRSPCKQLITD